MKNKVFTFAAIHAKNQINSFTVVAIFLPQIERYAAIIRLSTSLITTLYRMVMVLGGIEGDSLSYFTLIFHSTMPRANENASSAQGAITSRLTSEAVKSFSFEGTQDVQVVIIDGNPWFVATHVCDILGLSNTPKTVCGLDDDEKLLYPVVISGQQRTVNVVNESGLYALIFQSRKSIARKFRKWITSEVLPAIRKTGKYEAKGTGYNETKYQQEIKRLQIQNQILEMRVEMYKSTSQSHYQNLLSMYEVTKLILNIINDDKGRRLS